MTEMTTSSAIEGAFVPRGRPVARFVGAIAVVTAVLTVVWATGVANPRLDASIERGIGSGGGVAVLSVHNEGLFPARVRVVDISDRFVRLARRVPQVRLGPDATARIRVPYVVDCPRYDAARRTQAGASEPVLALVVEVRGPVGASRRRTWPNGGEVGVGRACPSG